ncbi:hypothetical protein ACFCYN_02230 [Gottfriedia sp. NPDC056225]|uniref:hypothetical protein n=1 Tax=Gottfriedia sp. NPDC056225 TaxID=3345751 RepID=UPI0035DAE774
MKERKEGLKKLKKSLLLLSIISSIIVITFEFTQWHIEDILTVFLMPFVLLIIFGFFLFVTVISFIVLFKNKNWKPVVVQIITILLLIFVPFNQIVLNADFKKHKPEREKVVKMVSNGSLKPNVSYNKTLIHLPKKYAPLSKGGGEIVVEGDGNNIKILFYTFRGVLDNFSGFVYSPHTKPSLNDFGGDFKQIEKLDKDWYFVGSY